MEPCEKEPKPKHPRRLNVRVIAALYAAIGLAGDGALNIYRDNTVTGLFEDVGAVAMLAFANWISRPAVANPDLMPRPALVPYGAQQQLHTTIPNLQPTPTICAPVTYQPVIVHLPTSAPVTPNILTTPPPQLPPQHP
jgi:hypothetical protein